MIDDSMWLMKVICRVVCFLSFFRFLSHIDIKFRYNSDCEMLFHCYIYGIFKFENFDADRKVCNQKRKMITGNCVVKCVVVSVNVREFQLENSVLEVPKSFGKGISLNIYFAKIGPNKQILENF